MTFSARHRQRIHWLLAHANELHLGKNAVQRLHWFAFACNHGGNASLTCRHFGIARSTYVRWLGRFRPSDERSLEDTSRRPKRVRRSLVPTDVISAITQLRKEHTTMDREEIAMILRERGMNVSLSAVGRIITRHRLFFGNTPSHQTKRIGEMNIDSSPSTVSPAPPAPPPSLSPSFA